MIKKIQVIYNKIAPKVAKIASICLGLSLLALVISAVLENNLTDPWPHYYAAVAEQSFTWITICIAVIWLIFDFKRIGAVVKEFLRKFFVMLKRNPSIIPLVMLLIAFLLFSLNLTDMSDTTAKIQGKGMGLSQFCIMLFSLLSMLCMLNAFPKRKKANIPMLILLAVMLAVIVFCDLYYCSAIDAARFRAENPITIDESTEYIAYAYNMLNTHVVLIVVSAALVALLPVYSKLLKKIKTSVAVEDNGSMEELELND